MQYVEITAIKANKDDLLKLEKDYVTIAKKALKGIKLTYNEYVDQFKEDKRVKDPEKRARWDLFYYMREILRKQDKIDAHYELMDRLYKEQGINDTNLDRYLKKFTKKLV